MTARNFKRLVVRDEDGRYARHVDRRPVNDLPDGDVLIRVHYSSLNYKDALSATGHRGVTRHYPHTPRHRRRGRCGIKYGRALQPWR